MSGRESMIRQMEKALGWGEPGNPAQRWYADRNGSFYRSAAWCDILVTWAAALSGNYAAVCFGQDYAYTVYHALRSQKAKLWRAGNGGIRRGDIVFFQWEGGVSNTGKIDHVGIVTDVKTTYIETIEGNTSDKCARRIRYRDSTISGYFSPNYVEDVKGGEMQLSDPVPVGETYKNDFKFDHYRVDFTLIGAFGEAKRARQEVVNLEKDMDEKFAEIDTRLDRIENVLNTILGEVKKTS